MLTAWARMRMRTHLAAAMLIAVAACGGDRGSPLAQLNILARQNTSGDAYEYRLGRGCVLEMTKTVNGIVVDQSRIPLRDIRLHVVSYGGSDGFGVRAMHYARATDYTVMDTSSEARARRVVGLVEELGSGCGRG
jgi:hypothetical protein